MISKSIKNYIIFNLILFITFSISVNSFVSIENINVISYIIFHISFIYFIFYFYHFSLFFISFFYGVLFDIFLLNSVGAHLIVFLILTLLFIFFKKYLLLMSSYQIGLLIYFVLIFIFFFEFILAYFLNNIFFNLFEFGKYTVISLIIFIPTIFFLNKFNK